MQHTIGGLLAIQSTLTNQGQENIGIEGVIQAGSYLPANGTVQVVMAHTVAAAAFTDAGGNQIYPTVVGAQLSAEGYGDQYGPVGGERCILRKNGTHWTATLEYSSDDSPGAPSGERWSLHYAPGTRNITTSWKLTNDGPAPGDGLGGFKVLAGGEASILTSGGFGLVAMNGASRLNGASMSTGNGLVRQSDLVALLVALQTALASWASASLAGGSGASGPTLAFTPSASTASYST